MHGKCSYILVDHSHYVGYKDFEIVTSAQCNSEDLSWFHDKCTRSVTINLLKSATTLVFDQKVRNGRRLPTVTVNGTSVRHSISNEFLLDVIGDESAVFVLKDKELTFEWTGHNAYITVGHHYENQTRGLCGTFNSIQEDDFHTRTGSTLTSVTSFAEQWVHSSSNDVSTCQNDWTTREKPCDIHSGHLSFANSVCTVIGDTNGAFAACHKTVPPNTYLEMCRQAACEYKDSYCNIMAAYAKLCVERGVTLDNWRSSIGDCRKYLFVLNHEFMKIESHFFGLFYN